MSIVRAAATVGSLTALSRVTGFVRDLMIAAILGAGPLADAFFVSFKLANFLRRLFAEGAFNAGFVPLFARTLEGEGPEAARSFAREALAVMTTVLLVVVLLAEIFMPALVRAIAWGFEPGQPRYETAVELSRVTFPYLMFISLAALFSGILNSIGRFAAAAFAPVLLNLVLISALLLGSLHPKTPAHALAWGVALAGVLQLTWVIIAARRNGMRIGLARPRITPRIRKLFALVLPGAVGAGVYQINLLVDTWFASTLPVGAVSYLFYADRLNQLPLGIVGIAIGTALLPLLSRQLRAAEHRRAQATQNRAIEMALLLTLPAAVALVAIGEPIVRLLFERGAFGPEATAATSGALMAFATGLPAYVLIKVLAPGFFAREDTRTPVVIAAICLGLNIVLILLFIGTLAHVGIALATALSNWLNVMLLGGLLIRRGHFELQPELVRRTAGLIGAALAMGVLLAALRLLLAGHHPLILVATSVILGGPVYFASAHLMGGTDLRALAGQFRRRAPGIT
ncbi:MAG: murein biosynthesis integral membrane protein MurJ [Geminicoccaceae bacterium]|nr:murein biosynthesis integral membrane protein MurJ [Geminicoccaceae bacterium]